MRKAARPPWLCRGAFQPQQSFFQNHGNSAVQLDHSFVNGDFFRVFLNGIMKAIFGGTHAEIVSENAIETSRAGKTAFKTDVCDGMSRVQKLISGVSQSGHVQKLRETHPHKIRKQMGYMGIAVADHVAHGSQRQLCGVIFGNVIHDVEHDGHFFSIQSLIQGALLQKAMAKGQQRGADDIFIRKRPFV